MTLSDADRLFINPTPVAAHAAKRTPAGDRNDALRTFYRHVLTVAGQGLWRTRCGYVIGDAPDEPTQPEDRAGTVVCDLTLEVEPTTKARPRHGNGRTYTPGETVKAEEVIRWKLRAARVQVDKDYLLAVTVTFRTRTAQRRDLDNLLKLLLDACNTFVWADDVQVVKIDAEVERGHESPGIDLKVTRVRPRVPPCGRCGKPVRTRTGKFCSRECYDAAQRQGSTAPCSGDCGRTVHIQRTRPLTMESYCSNECRSKSLAGRKIGRDTANVGQPGLVLVRQGRLVMATLLLDEDQPTAEQLAWLEDLRGCIGVEAYLWRPSDLAEVRRVLA